MTSLIDRFRNPKTLLDALRRQQLLLGDQKLAEALAARGELISFKAGEVMITQGAWDTDLYFIVAGAFNVVINGQQKAIRDAGACVGELAGLSGDRARTATLVARSESLAVKVSQEVLEELTAGNADFWKRAADVVASRLDQRNAEIGATNVCPRVFVISSSEGLEVARRIRAELDSTDIHVHLWNKGTFSLSEYPISDLEDAIEAADFTISVVRPDDELVMRRQSSTTSRDNVHLEFGMSIGKLGRPRSVLLVASDPTLHLPSDVAGLTTLRYRAGDKDELARTVAAACDEMRAHVETHGVRSDRRK